MKDSLQEGLTFEYQYQIPEDKTVPYLFPDMPEGQVMPKVFATGFLVGLFEFACIKFLKAHLEWPDEQTVGISVNISHLAATPPGLTVTVKGKLEKKEGKKLTFSLTADDGIDKISAGTHVRFVIRPDKFNQHVAEKQKKASA